MENQITASQILTYMDGNIRTRLIRRLCEDPALDCSEVEAFVRSMSRVKLLETLELIDRYDNLFVT